MNSRHALIACSQVPPPHAIVYVFPTAIYKMQHAAIADLMIRAVRRLQADDNVDVDRSLGFL